MPILLAVLFIMVFFEGTITTIPLALCILVVLATKADKTSVLLTAFLSGMFLDILRVRAVGQTSLVLVTFLFFIFLYENKYETNTLPFIAAATFIGSVLYGSILDVPAVFLSACITTSIASLTFIVSTHFSAKPEKSRYSGL